MSLQSSTVCVFFALTLIVICQGLEFPRETYLETTLIDIGTKAESDRQQSVREAEEAAQRLEREDESVERDLLKENEMDTFNPKVARGNKELSDLAAASSSIATEVSSSTDNSNDSDETLRDSATDSASSSSATNSAFGKDSIAETLEAGSIFIKNSIAIGARRADISNADVPPQGRIMMVGEKAGVYFWDRQAGGSQEWKLYSDTNGCFTSALLDAWKGFRICETIYTNGLNGSGNVFLSGDLGFIAGEDLKMKRLHLIEAAMESNGFVLKIGQSPNPSLNFGTEPRFSWLQAMGSKPTVLNPLGGNVGIGTSSPDSSLHVQGDMQIRGTLILKHQKAFLNDNKLRFHTGQGWYMTDSKWLRALGDAHIKSESGAWFTAQVGINYNFLENPSKAALHISGGILAVTRTFGKSEKGIALFFDDKLGEARLEARDFTLKRFQPLRMEAHAILLVPGGRDQTVAIGTKSPKAHYVLHIEGNNKIDGHIYITKKLKVGKKAHVNNLHAPRLKANDPTDGGLGAEVSSASILFVIGDYEPYGISYVMKPGGTSLRVGYYEKYCWIQTFPAGKSGPPLVFNGAGNAVAMGTTTPKNKFNEGPTNSQAPSSASVNFHVSGSMYITGHMTVEGKVLGQSNQQSSGSSPTPSPQDYENYDNLKGGDTSNSRISFMEISGKDLHPHARNQLNYVWPSVDSSDPKKFGFRSSPMHKEAVNVEQIEALLMANLQSHMHENEIHAKTISQQMERVSQLETKLSLLEA